MLLYHLTLQRATAILKCVSGNFSAPKAQEIIVSRGKKETKQKQKQKEKQKQTKQKQKQKQKQTREVPHPSPPPLFPFLTPPIFSPGRVLELLRPDDNNRLISVVSHDVFGTIRSIQPFRLTGGNRDYLVVGSDSVSFLSFFLFFSFFSFFLFFFFFFLSFFLSFCSLSDCQSTFDITPHLRNLSFILIIIIILKISLFREELLFLNLMKKQTVSKKSTKKLLERVDAEELFLDRFLFLFLPLPLSLFSSPPLFPYLSLSLFLPSSLSFPPPPPPPPPQIVPRHRRKRSCCYDWCYRKTKTCLYS